MKLITKALLLTFVIRSLSIAGIITHTDYTAGAVITAAGQNTNENKIFNEFNGNIDNTNIKTGGILGANLANGTVTTTQIGAATIASSNLASSITITTLTATNIIGTITNDNAAVGNFGQYTSSYTALRSLVDTTYVNVAQIALTAGDWDVSGNAIVTYTAGTPQNADFVVLSQFSGNTTTDHSTGDNQLSSAVPPSNAFNATIGAWRVSVAGSTTVFLKAMFQSTGGTGTAVAAGRVSARRVR